MIMPPVGDLDLYVKPEDKLDKKSLISKRRNLRVPQGLSSIGTHLHKFGYCVKDI